LLWTGRPILIQDVRHNPQLAEEIRLEKNFGLAICVQVAVDQTTLGYVHADCIEAGAFTEADVRVVQAFADFAALAVNKSMLHDANLRLDPVDHETELQKLAPFMAKLQEHLDRARLLHERFAILLMDVDNFKHIVSTFGCDEFIVLRSGAGADEATNFAGV